MICGFQEPMSNPMLLNMIEVSRLGLELPAEEFQLGDTLADAE